MAISQKVIKFLEKNKLKYEPIEHRKVFTAYDKGQTLKIPQKIIGKTLVVKLDKGFAIVLIPANKILDKGKFKKIVNNWLKKSGKKLIKNIDFATEAWMKKNLKGVKVGAIPPFGNLWQLPTFIDRGLIQSPKIIVNGGDYNISIKISLANFKKLIPGLITGNFGKAKK